jgi:type III secretory pathway component EscV
MSFVLPGCYCLYRLVAVVCVAWLHAVCVAWIPVLHVVCFTWLLLFVALGCVLFVLLGCMLFVALGCMLFNQAKQTTGNQTKQAQATRQHKQHQPSKTNNRHQATKPQKQQQRSNTNNSNQTIQTKGKNKQQATKRNKQQASNARKQMCCSVVLLLSKAIQFISAQWKQRAEIVCRTILRQYGREFEMRIEPKKKIIIGVTTIAFHLSRDRNRNKKCCLQGYEFFPHFHFQHCFLCRESDPQIRLGLDA